MATQIFVKCPESNMFVPVEMFFFPDEFWFRCDFEKCPNKDRCKWKGESIIKVKKTDSSS